MSGYDLLISSPISFDFITFSLRRRTRVLDVHKRQNRISLAGSRSYTKKLIAQKKVRVKTTTQNKLQSFSRDRMKRLAWIQRRCCSNSALCVRSNNTNKSIRQHFLRSRIAFFKAKKERLFRGRAEEKLKKKEKDEKERKKKKGRKEKNVSEVKALQI